MAYFIGGSSLAMELGQAEQRELSLSHKTSRGWHRELLARVTDSFFTNIGVTDKKLSCRASLLNKGGRYAHCCWLLLHLFKGSFTSSSVKHKEESH